ncbi:MAG: phage tail assembly protein [Clostridia bacterium]|nr:phage tail assembly protein [Clostridia bacterium]
MSATPFETQVEFELPKGYIDKTGEVHKKGVMRLANAADEIVPLNDPRVKMNPGYLSILLLERVVVKLGTLKKVDSHVIENLFTADMAYLQDLYQKVNAVEPQFTNITCPKCSHEFRYELPFFGEA